MCVCVSEAWCWQVCLLLLHSTGAQILQLYPCIYCSNTYNVPSTHTTLLLPLPLPCVYNPVSCQVLDWWCRCTKKKYKIHTCQSVSELGTNIQVGHEVYSRGAPKTGSQFICYFSNLPQNTMRNQKKISVLTPKQAHGEGVESYVSCSNTSSKSYRGGVRLNGTVSLQH